MDVHNQPGNPVAFVPPDVQQTYDMQKNALSAKITEISDRAKLHLSSRLDKTQKQILKNIQKKNNANKKQLNKIDGCTKKIFQKIAKQQQANATKTSKNYVGQIEVKIKEVDGLYKQTIHLQQAIEVRLHIAGNISTTIKNVKKDIKNFEKYKGSYAPNVQKSVNAQISQLQGKVKDLEELQKQCRELGIDGQQNAGIKDRLNQLRGEITDLSNGIEQLYDESHTKKDSVLSSIFPFFKHKPFQQVGMAKHETVTDGMSINSGLFISLEKFLAMTPREWQAKTSQQQIDIARFLTSAPQNIHQFITKLQTLPGNDKFLSLCQKLIDRCLDISPTNYDMLKRSKESYQSDNPYNELSVMDARTLYQRKEKMQADLLPLMNSQQIINYQNNQMLLKQHIEHMLTPDQKAIIKAISTLTNDEFIKHASNVSAKMQQQVEVMTEFMDSGQFKRWGAGEQLEYRTYLSLYQEHQKALHEFSKKLEIIGLQDASQQFQSLNELVKSDTFKNYTATLEPLANHSSTITSLLTEYQPQLEKWCSLKNISYPNLMRDYSTYPIISATKFDLALKQIHENMGKLGNTVIPPAERTAISDILKFFNDSLQSINSKMAR